MAVAGLIALAVLVLLGLSPATARAGHTVFVGGSVEGEQVASTASGRPQVRLSWDVRCSGGDAYGGVIGLYSYDEGRVVSTPVSGVSLPLSSSVITAKTAGPGKYQPRLIGTSCLLTQSGPGSPPEVVPGEDPHVGTGPSVIAGPDFYICEGGPTRSAGASMGARSRAKSSSATWPLVPTIVAGPCGDAGKERQRRCNGSGSASASGVPGTAWPLVPVPDDCEPICIERGQQVENAPPGVAVIPAVERCAPELMRRKIIPLPYDCPGASAGSSTVPRAGSSAAAWPVVPTRAGCSGRIDLFAPEKSKPCGSAARASGAAAWPVVPCKALRRVRFTRIGAARFAVRAGGAGIVPVRVRPKTARVIRKVGRVPVRARIITRKGNRRVRTIRSFVVRGR